MARDMLPAPLDRLAASKSMADIEYTPGMHVKVRLSSGHVVYAEIKSVDERVTGTKLRIVFGNQSVMIDTDQVIEVMESS